MKFDIAQWQYFKQPLRVVGRFHAPWQRQGLFTFDPFGVMCYRIEEYYYFSAEYLRDEASAE